MPIGVQAPALTVPKDPSVQPGPEAELLFVAFPTELSELFELVLFIRGAPARASLGAAAMQSELNSALTEK